MYGNPMYSNQMYQQDLQNMRDRIDRQLNQMQSPNTQQTPITQNFQLAPTKGSDSIRYVKDVEDVKKELVFADSLFVDRDFKNMWMKDAKGDIRSFEITEVLQKDEKDLEIENLKNQINELKGMINDAKYATSDVDGTTSVKKSKNVSDDKSSEK